MNKKKQLLLLFVTLNTVVILINVYKNTLIAKLQFQEQRYSTEKTALKKQLDELVCTLQKVKSYENITQFAHTQLGMDTMRLTQIKTITIR